MTQPDDLHGVTDDADADEKAMLDALDGFLAGRGRVRYARLSFLGIGYEYGRRRDRHGGRRHVEGDPMNGCGGAAREYSAPPCRTAGRRGPAWRGWVRGVLPARATPWTARRPHLPWGRCRAARGSGSPRAARAGGVPHNAARPRPAKDGVQWTA
ncbi:hypothetical protein [Spongiactinospora rosea]|uniref:hypothetical protein n=1 Tax=Spongiactinospora rosea TaxID=2248750 RepID=UPI0011C06E8A|nr:hypothetical protein [Spongiactinospora rosea]